MTVSVTRCITRDGMARQYKPDRFCQTIVIDAMRIAFACLQRPGSRYNRSH